MASSEKWASGQWIVKAGSEDEFVERWRAWLSWTKDNCAGLRSATLIRAEDGGQRFISFSDWDDASTRAAWEGSDEFREKMGAVRELCEDVQSGNYELAAGF